MFNNHRITHRVEKMAFKNKKVVINQDDTNLIEDTYIIDKQPLLLCDKILPDKNNENISHVYQSDSDDHPEEPRSASLKEKVQRKRKRKQADGLQTFKYFYIFFHFFIVFLIMIFCITGAPCYACLP